MTDVRRAGLRAGLLLLLLGSLLAALGSPASAVAPGRTTASPAIVTTSDDGFYLPPSPLPAGAPGDVLRARPAPAGPSTAQKLANAWQVLYLSTDARGNRTAMSGTVVVPKGAPATAPLVALAPGTQGVSFRCAPSKMIEAGAFYEQPQINSLLRKGYAVVVPDYEGYRPEPAATYMTGPSMGHAVLDLLRAATRVPDAGRSAQAPVVIRGYSQGGGAALWSAELQPSYAPELPLKGVVAGGVPGNLSLVATRLSGTSGFGLMAIALIGFDNAYPELNLAGYLNDAGKTAFAKMENGDCALELLAGYGGKTIGDYTTANPLQKLDWLIRVDESTLGKQKIDVPVFEYHATTDGLVAYDQAASLRSTYCGKGVPVQWKTYDTGYLGTTAAAHISPISWADPDVLAFIADRLAGKPATPNC